MNTTCFAVTPMSCCQVARSSSTDWRTAAPRPHPIRRAQEDALAVIAPVVAAVVGRPVVDPEQDPAAVSRQPVHVRCDGDGQPAGEFLRLQEPRVLRGDPGLGQRQDRSRVPEHGGIGVGLLAHVRDGPAVSDLHCVQSAPAAAQSRSSLAPSSPAADPSRPPAPDPHGQAGPARNRVPWRSGGNEPDIGRASAPSRSREVPITSRTSDGPMRPINLPAYGKVEACPRSRRTSPSAA